MKRKLVSCFIFSTLAIVVSMSLIWSAFPGENLSDFGSFVASGQAITAGQNPYGVYPLVFHIELPFTTVDAVNLNAPASLLPFAALGYLDPHVAFCGWYIISIALYVVTIGLLIWAYPEHASWRRVAWAFSLAGLWHTLQLGQIYVPLVLATVAAWLLMQRGHWKIAGVLIGVVVAIKPTFGIWPLFLLLGGQFTVAAVALGTVVLLSAVPIFIFGPSIYLQWIQATLGFDGVLLPGNASIQSLVARLGADWLGYPLAVLLTLIIAVLIWRYRPNAPAISALAIPTILLISPLTWTGYALFLLPVFFSRRWSPALRVAATVLVFPFWVLVAYYQQSPVLFVLLGSLWFWPVAALLVASIRETVLKIPQQGVLLPLPETDDIDVALAQRT